MIWHFCSKRKVRIMEKIQERYLRFVFNDSSSTYSSLLNRAKKDTLHVIRLKQILIFVYKCINHVGPTYLHSLFTVKQTYYNLRNCVSLEQPKVNTILHGMNSIIYHGAKLWNDLPNSIYKEC